MWYAIDQNCQPTNQDESMKITSCQAPLMNDHCRAIVAYLAERLHLTLTFIDDISWQERYEQLDRGGLDVAWICGAPYVRRVDQPDPGIELLAAPVWLGERYGNRPVYFSDVVVHQDSRFQSFADLQGATWAYNEAGSFSGYEAMRYHLAAQGLSGDFFGRVVASGSHQQSLALILARQAEVAAVDSTVLGAVVGRQPALAQQLRTIAVIGPSPMPPWVVARRVPAEVRQRLRNALLTMSNDPAGATLLQQGEIARFAAVGDGDYDPIRRMLARAATVQIPITAS
jgi:phosphonate transport system substrate-binding protein